MRKSLLISLFLCGSLNASYVSDIYTKYAILEDEIYIWEMANWPKKIEYWYIKGQFEAYKYCLDTYWNYQDQDESIQPEPL